MTEKLEYGIAFEIDGDPCVIECPPWSYGKTTDLTSAYRQIGRLAAHHGKHHVSASGYRVVVRTVTASEWTSPS